MKTKIENLSRQIVHSIAAFTLTFAFFGSVKAQLPAARDSSVEFDSVIVNGAVIAPTRFRLRRKVRLTELLAAAGGVTERAGKFVVVAHAELISDFQTLDPKNTHRAMQVTSTAYKLSDIVRGDEKANPYVQPGDVVKVSEKERAYVTGAVVNPTEFVLEENMTVAQAIAKAGGTRANADAKHIVVSSDTEHIFVSRPSNGFTLRALTYVDLNKINKHPTQDVTLRANDIVCVPFNYEHGRCDDINSKMLIAPRLSNPSLQLPVRILY
jgi:protein involved in polysaccharide export with SLBB domain